MSINIHNYEAYFLDYYEGRLDDQTIKGLIIFLNQYPQFKEEFESYEHISLNITDKVTFDDKAKLKKYITPVNPSNFDEIAAQDVDGTLNKELQKELEKFVKLNPNYERELALYRSTKLIPDNTIVFENKEALKRNIRKPVVWFYWSAAASVALLIAAYFMFWRQPKDNTLVLTHTHNVIDTITHKAIAPQPLNNTPSPVNIAQNEPKKSKPIVAKIQKHTLVPIPMPEYRNSTAPEDSVHIVINTSQQKAPILSNDSAKKTFATTDSVHKTDTANAIKDIAISTNWNDRNTKKRETLKRVLYAFASPFKSVGRFFRHPIDIRKCYSKETDKVIAYQVDLGDNRYTFPVKNSSY